MLGTFSFKCSNGHYHDEFVHRDVESRDCPHCGEQATKVIRYAPKLDYLGMGAQKHAGPEFADRFDKMHRDRKAHEEKNYENHGDYGPAAGS